jgi:hypothetical protein
VEVAQLKVRTGSLRGVIAVSSVSGLLTSKFEALSEVSKVILRDPCNLISGFVSIQIKKPLSGLFSGN